MGSSLKNNKFSAQEMVDPDEVVISGIGGKFPESDNVLELQEKLFAKEDFVTNTMRWTTGE